MNLEDLLLVFCGFCIGRAVFRRPQWVDFAAWQVWTYHAVISLLFFICLKMIRG